MYQLQFASSHHLTDEDERTLVVNEYDDLGSMYMLVLQDGSRQSVGKQLIESIEETDG
ncbi:MAG: hypothetical protein J07HN4v3_01735 [Halonotius sp. J07HN4]|nr:MAG: hypothetical protein J07HN4v3_01735 [Halonotius sp. J07HN4]